MPVSWTSGPDGSGRMAAPSLNGHPWPAERLAARAAPGRSAPGACARPRRAAVARRMLRTESVQRRDYILREIERLGQILARIRDRILGRATSIDELRRDLSGAAGSLGLDLDLAHRV